MELLSVAQRKMERIMLGIALRDYKRTTWIRHQTGVKDIIDVIKKGIHGWAGGAHCTIQRQHMDYKSDRVDTMRMDKMAGMTFNKMERQTYPPHGSCVAKNSQRLASVETVQGAIHPYGVKEPLVVNGKWYLMDQLAMRTGMQ